MKSYDVIIIGGGLAGLMTALALVQSGRKVIILEAGQIAASASAGLVGALAPHMPEHWNDKKEYQFQSMKMAAEFWPHWENETGLLSGYQRRGRWQAISDETMLAKAKMREEAAKQSWRGEADWIILERQTAPFANSKHGVIEDSLSAQIFPREAIKLLEKACQISGVDIHQNRKVTEFSHGYVYAGEPYQTDAIVIAGGYQAWPFLRPFLGSEFGEGIKGQAALIALECDWNFPMITGDGYYIIPHQPRLLGIGSTSERYWSHTRVDHHLDALFEKVESEVSLPPYQIVETWSGIRPRAYRPDPLMGEISPGIFVNAGGFKTGFSFMNKISEDLAYMINGQPVSVPENFHVINHLLSRYN